jgi:hypothetical protein
MNIPAVHTLIRQPKNNNISLNLKNQGDGSFWKPMENPVPGSTQFRRKPANLYEIAKCPAGIAEYESHKKHFK